MLGIRFATLSKSKTCFVDVNLSVNTHCFFSKSFGPISNLKGTPFNSHLKNFEPGDLD
jgi:hypothetical protein